MVFALAWLKANMCDIFLVVVKVIGMLLVHTLALWKYHAVVKRVGLLVVRIEG